MTIINTSFSTGTILHTSTINETAKANPVFALFIMQSINRHRNNDWGACCEEDWKSNDTALIENNRIISVYPLPQDLKKLHRDDKIWIITERDRSYTTILYPSEY